MPQTTLEGYLEPHIGQDDSRPASVEPEDGTPALWVAPTSVVDTPDVVSVGVVSEPEARWLFEQ